MLLYKQVKWKLLSRVQLFATPGQNTRVGSFSLLQGIFPTQGLNTSLPHCRRILYQLNHPGNPRILEWVAYPFSSRSFWPRNWTRVFCITGRFFTNWATREALICPETPLCGVSVGMRSWWRGVESLVQTLAILQALSCLSDERFVKNSLSAEVQVNL